jgi:hypothetical protein
MVVAMLKLGWLIPLAMIVAGACKKGDECQQYWDRTSVLMAKAAGDKLPPDAKTKFLKECREGDRIKKDPMFRCVTDASGDDAVKACMSKAFGDYMAKSKLTEAALQLNRIGKDLKLYVMERDAFPIGNAGPTPAEPCCKGENHKCPVVPIEQWSASEIWKLLDFEISEPTLFQYSYESTDGKTATATAVGDLDCDGTMITYKLEASIEDGVAKVNIVKPAENAD